MTTSQFFADHPEAAVAFSGGVDSAWLLHEAVRHARRTAAYFVKTPFQPDFELDDARDTVRRLGASLTVLALDILAVPAVAANPADRCYHCKRALFSRLLDEAAADGFPLVLDGSNASDDAGDRPGMRALRELGYDGLTIGVETGDGEALAFMNKGYGPEDIVQQARRLDEAGMTYNFFYLTGISGAGRGEEGARRSAEVFNRTHPRMIGASMLTIFPESELWREIQRGSWTEESELEKLAELKVLIERLTIPTCIATEGASNLIQVRGELPGDRERLAGYLGELLATADEGSLRAYRTSLRHL